MLLQSRYRRGRSFSEINSGLQRTYIPLYERAFVSLQRKLGSVPTYRPESVTNEEHAITDLEAFINLLKCALGTGCLAMPCAFYEAGWLLGLIGTLVLGSFVVYAMHVLINDINVLCKRYRLSVLSYSEAMELAFQTGPESLQPLGKPLAGLAARCLSFWRGLRLCCVYSQEHQAAGGHVYRALRHTHLYGPANGAAVGQFCYTRAEISSALCCHIQSAADFKRCYYLQLFIWRFAQPKRAPGRATFARLRFLLWHRAVLN
ncbi:uncharacterized protein LOC108598640 isoform X2 [Drosophila busckii]|uniref:uncharacterized protein LOC108598640 isoform X2 n=1 Tax=Drosophila busckii TaxID=30019 RepID=UPI001432F837|nr:uncharacterized protein LOC108598640 isoform X2 [Drosophila busckii]